MASTPPRQIQVHAATPNTPLHGPAYDNEDSPRRTSARLRQKRVHNSFHRPTETNLSSTPAHDTPRSPRSRTTLEVTTPASGRTPKRRPTQVVRVLSPSSDSEPSTSRHTKLSRTKPRPFASSTTVISEGMLPTPVKTPKKKTISKSNLAARALFNEHQSVNDSAPSPRKVRKSKRYNGFSLESFRATEDGDQGGIQIFTDSRDQVPEADDSSDNPFVEEHRRGTRSRQVAGTSKRRKVSTPRSKDPQVMEAIEKDEGMVYVFRGKKVYRRFDDTGEEEEEIDAGDFGLLSHATNGSKTGKSLRTMTRKSIKPTRLFQTEAQLKARELEKEEEALTDIEEPVLLDDVQSFEVESPAKFLRKSGQTTRPGKSPFPDSGGADLQRTGAKSPKGSPFDSWKRYKFGSTVSASKPSKSRKRVASESVDEVHVEV